jgi:hypothetical protein
MAKGDRDAARAYAKTIPGMTLDTAREVFAGCLSHSAVPPVLPLTKRHAPVTREPRPDRPLRRSIIARLRKLPPDAAWDFVATLATTKGRRLPDRPVEIGHFAGSLLGSGFSGADLRMIHARLERLEQAQRRARDGNADRASAPAVQEPIGPAHVISTSRPGKLRRLLTFVARLFRRERQ